MGNMKRKRLLEVVFVLIVVACVALIFQRNRQTVAERELEQEELQQAQELVESTSETTAEVMQQATELLVEGVRMTAAPDLTDLRYQKLEIYNRALAEDPNNRRNLYKRIGLYADLGLYEAALPDLDKLIELSPDDFELYRWRANFHTKLGDHEAEVADFTVFIDATPQPDAGALNGRAYALAELGRFEEALVDIEKSVSIERKSHNLDTLGYVYVGLERYEEALSAYNETLKLEPTSLYALRGRAVTYRQLGQLEASQADLDAGKRIDSDFCLHWTKEMHPGVHSEEDKSVLEASVP
jgi:tetratricopeptide (TPR) repeat protein